MFAHIRYGNVSLPILLAICTILFCTVGIASAIGDSGFQGYYGYLWNDGGDYPPAWSNPAYCDFAYGIDHDDDHWYITQASTIWKIPVERSLNDIPYYYPPFGVPVTQSGLDQFYASYNILSKRMFSYTTLTNLGITRFAEPAYYNHNGKGYVLSSVFTQKNEEHPVAPRYLAVFDADTLDLIDYALYNGNPELGAMTVGSDGIVYGIAPITISGNTLPPYEWSNRILRYQINWDHLVAYSELLITPLEGLPVFNKLGEPVTINSGFDVSNWCGDICVINYGQESSGCDISPDGKLFYIVKGPSLGWYTDIDTLPVGIHVFNLETGQLIQSSTNSYVGEQGHFDLWYDYYADEDPAGLTIWDLDEDPRAPNIGGQLHVLVKDYDEFSSDDIRISHYTNKVYVDSSYTDAEKGTKNKPFNTVPEAVSYSWDKSGLILPAGNYSVQNLIIDKQIKIFPVGGTVVLGE